MVTIFLDRDGVINRNREDYVKSWEEFEFLPNSLKALRLLTTAGYQLIVITNQACINKELISSDILDAIHRQMVIEIENAGGRVRAIYYCPHRGDEGCDCRKPRPGMLIQAASEHAIDLSSAYFIGDSMRDIAAGQQVGCRTCLVLTGHGTQLHQKPLNSSALSGGVQPEKVFTDLYAAALWIVENH